MMFESHTPTVRIQLAPILRSANRDAVAKAPEVTLHQLRIFWAVAHSQTLTRAAKQLGMAQPSLSQQLAKLEATVGTRLFERRSNEMIISEAGRYLLPKAEQLLRDMRDLEEGLREFSDDQRITVSLAGISSLLRVLLPEAVRRTQMAFPLASFDIQEAAPAEILEMLHSRRIKIGLLASNSIVDVGAGYQQMPLIEDPYILAVPEKLDLDGVGDPVRDLDGASADLLNRSIQFVSGTRHGQHLADWYDAMLPDHRPIAHCRSYEVAMGLVRAGSGVCLAPLLSTLSDAGPPSGIRLYRVNVPERRLVALIAAHHGRQEPYASLLVTLKAVGMAQKLPEIRPVPPFLDSPFLSIF